MAVNAITGEAHYRGEAFGRYAEDDDGAMTVGRFTADANLMADFGDDETAGSIHGGLTGFVANGESRDDWDVRFESAAIEPGMRVNDQGNTDPTDDVMEADPNSQLRFNAGASATL